MARSVIECGRRVIERLPTARELGELLGLSASTVFARHEPGELPSFELGTGS